MSVYVPARPSSSPGMPCFWDVLFSCRRAARALGSGYRAGHISGRAPARLLTRQFFRHGRGGTVPDATWAANSSRRRLVMTDSCKSATLASRRREPGPTPTARAARGRAAAAPRCRLALGTPPPRSQGSARLALQSPFWSTRGAPWSFEELCYFSRRWHTSARERSGPLEGLARRPQFPLARGAQRAQGGRACRRRPGRRGARAFGRGKCRATHGACRASSALPGTEDAVEAWRAQEEYLAESRRRSRGGGPTGFLGAIRRPGQAALPCAARRSSREGRRAQGQECPCEVGN